MDMSEKSLAWLGLIIGVPGFLVLFFSDHVAIAIIVAVVVVGLVWLKLCLNLPEFTLLSVEKSLTIKDTKGKSANLRRCQTAVANHKGLTEFWCRNISADGTISNIAIDEKPPHVIKKEAGDTQVCKRFDHPLQRGHQFKMMLSYDLTDSFLCATESVIHVVECKTKKLTIVVTLPKKRVARSARAFLRFGGQVHKALHPPTISGCKVEFEIKPKLGAEYCLEWDW